MLLPNDLIVIAAANGLDEKQLQALKRKILKEITGKTTPIWDLIKSQKEQT